MSNTIVSAVTRRKKILVALGLPVLAAAWWAFRPEKLFINQRVSEPAPFAASSGPQPVLTGSLENGAHVQVGRATIYKTNAGHYYLRITGLSASAAQFGIALKGAGPEISLGGFRNRSEQNIDLPASFGPNQYDSAVIDDAHGDTFAIARLQPF